MQDFANHYFTEKTIATSRFDSKEGSPEENKCMEIGQRLADRFGLRFDGWWELSYQFTILKGLPDEQNTFLAKNEEEVFNSLQKKFPNYFGYIMGKNFPNGYKPDPSIPSDTIPECEPLDLDTLKKGTNYGLEKEFY